MLDLANVKKLIEQSYAARADAEFGRDGTTAVSRLLDGIQQIFQHCPPDQIQEPFLVASFIDSGVSSRFIIEDSSSTDYTDARLAAAQLMVMTAATECLVEIREDGTFRISQVAGDDFDKEPFLGEYIFYRYENGSERIRFRSYNQLIPKVDQALKSNFAVPTYSGLESALQSYSEVALESKCPTLKSVWEGSVDGPRLVLINKPEATMRDSLSHALSIRLGGEASVKPEYNSDESKPVDIRVDWHGSGASALIEIKWLGRSTAKKRSANGSDYTDYDVARARTGSKQLADYLDRNRRFDTNLKPMGYHVVFDARRKNVRGPSDALSREDALHFADSDIDYDPDHHAIREDFGEYVRFFMKPRESHFAA